MRGVTAPGRALDRISSASLRRYFFELEERFLWRTADAQDKVVLDLGCGDGRLLYSLRDTPCTLIGLDVDAGAVKHAVSAMRTGVGEAALLVGDGLNLPLKSSTVDLVVVLGTFQYTTDLTPFLKEIRRVLRTDGHLAFLVWASHPWSRLPVLGLKSQVGLHTIASIKRQLDSFGFQLDVWQGVFFLPRWLFWGVYRRLPRFLRRPLLESARVTEGWLGRSRLLHRFGWEYLVYARRS